MTTDDTDKEIQAKGLTARRALRQLTWKRTSRASGTSMPATALYADDFQPPVPANHPLRLLTFCVLVLLNHLHRDRRKCLRQPGELRRRA